MGTLEMEEVEGAEDVSMLTVETASCAEVSMLMLFIWGRCSFLSGVVFFESCGFFFVGFFVEIAEVEEILVFRVV